MIHCDKSLPSAARAYIDDLPDGDWFLFDMSPLDITGVPAWKAAYFPHDPTAGRCTVQQGTGYGEAAAQAMIAAVAECYEEVSARRGFALKPVVHGSYAALVAERGRDGVADPFLLGLPAGSTINHDTRLAWVEAQRWFTREAVLVPVDIAALDSATLPTGYRPFTTLITNGLGAGPSLKWAASHGLFECLQRDGNGVAFRALDRGIELSFDAVLPPALEAAMDQVASAGIELLPKFATDEFGIANVFVVGADRHPNRLACPIALTGAGEGADLDRNSALRKAVLEYAHARARKAFAFGSFEAIRAVMPAGYWERVELRVRRAARATEPRQVEAFREWLALDGAQLRNLLADTVFAVRGKRAFETLPISDIDMPEQKGAEAARRLIEAGFDPLILDFSPPGGAMHAARVIVPGLEVETLSYHRIGERNAAKLIAMDSKLIGWGAPSETRRPIALTSAARERLGGVPLLDIAAVDRLVGQLYPLYREPGAHELLYHGRALLTESMA